MHECSVERKVMSIGDISNNSIKLVTDIILVYFVILVADILLVNFILNTAVTDILY